jgi:hypothetical protein
MNSAPGDLVQRLGRRVVSPPDVRPRLPSRYETMRAPMTEPLVVDRFVEPPAQWAAPVTPANMSDIAPPSAPGPAPAPRTLPVVPPQTPPPVPSARLMPSAIEPAGPGADRLVETRTGDVHIHVAPGAQPRFEAGPTPAPIDAAVPREPAAPLAIEMHTTTIRVLHETLTPLNAVGPPSMPPAETRPAAERRGGAPAMPSSPPLLAGPDEPVAVPPIEITIGRIEIRTNSEPPSVPARAAAPARRAALPLAEYLRRRDGRRW